MTTHEDITLIKGAIHNPTEPRHFMQLVPASAQYIARVGTTVVARSDAATIVKEVGRGVYDPVVYFERDAVDMTALSKIDKSTHCPLKGDTEYFDLDAGGIRIAEAAWSYVDMVAGDELKDLVAFDAAKVTIEASR